ncbi:hypothetical protein Ahy_A01g002184 isoform B [Arachis hypogaea]|uniref:Uncharacterized protein n=1 Tax=Arachis hypogaea TaxID=3818 RepID=A0A445EQI4_ARAHY|nr:hypothetical protein Ahy_A01g002184 isoform B [Arachis hypogaea]
MEIIFELGSQGNLGFYYLDHICDLFTYSKKYENLKVLSGLSYNLNMLFRNQSIRYRITQLWFIYI